MGNAAVLAARCSRSSPEPGEGPSWDAASIAAVLAVASERRAEKLWPETIKGSVPLGFAADPGLCHTVVNGLERQ